MLAVLKNRQIRYLFLSCFLILFTGMGLLPILPLYAEQFQASNSLIGLYMAIMYVANALGPVAASWLITRFSKRLVFTVGGLVGLPTLILLATARTFVEVIVYTSILWFSGGILMTLISILTGFYTDAGNRGKAFSMMTMVGPLGSLAGGGVVGGMVTWQGYAAMFITLAIVWSLIPLIGWFRLQDVVRPENSENRSAVQKDLQSDPADRLGAQFIRLLVIVFLGSVATNVSRFGLTLSMQAAEYTANSIASAAMISGLVAIPLTLTIGSFSDRLGRKHFLGISFMFILSAAMILTNAKELWQYWLAAILNMAGYSVSGAMAQAMTGEVVATRSLDRGLSWLNISGSVANVVCFAAGGVLVDVLGLFQVFLMVMVAATIASAAIELFLRSGSTANVKKNDRMIKRTAVNRQA